MLVQLLIATAGKDLRLHGTTKVGNFFRSFINQQNDDPGLGIVRMDRLCYLLQKPCLSRLGRGDYQSPCPFTHGRHKINNPHARFTRSCQMESFARVYCGQSFIGLSGMKGIWCEAGYGFHRGEHRSGTGFPHRTCDSGAPYKTIFLNKLGRYRDVTGPFAKGKQWVT